MMTFLDDLDRAERLSKLASRLPDGSSARVAAERDIRTLEHRAAFDQELMELAANVEVWKDKGKWPARKTNAAERAACEDCDGPGLSPRDIATNALLKLGKSRSLPR